ncbi:hypothetical protein CALCODRAFT_515923, partial [Calocera cornea HHB12733]
MAARSIGNAVVVRFASTDVSSLPLERLGTGGGGRGTPNHPHVASRAEWGALCTLLPCGVVHSVPSSAAAIHSHPSKATTSTSSGNSTSTCTTTMNDASSSLFHQLQLGNSTNWGIHTDFHTTNTDTDHHHHHQLNGDAHFPDPTLDFPIASTSTPAPRPSIIDLKRRYLTHLPPARLVSTILDLELRGQRHDPSFGAHMWPPDLDSAVRDMEDGPPGTGTGTGTGSGEEGARRISAGPLPGKSFAPGRPLGRGAGAEDLHPGSNGLPNYEEMIVEALFELGEEEGVQPKVIFDWIAERYPINSNFRPSAHQAIQKSHKRGRLEKTGNKYRLNPDWDGT